MSWSEKSNRDSESPTLTDKFACIYQIYCLSIEMLVAGCSMLKKENSIPYSIQYPETASSIFVLDFQLTLVGRSNHERISGNFRPDTQ